MMHTPKRKRSDQAFESRVSPTWRPFSRRSRGPRARQEPGSGQHSGQRAAGHPPGHTLSIPDRLPAVYEVPRCSPFTPPLILSKRVRQPPPAGHAMPGGGRGRLASQRAVCASGCVRCRCPASVPSARLARAATCLNRPAARTGLGPASSG